MCQEKRSCAILKVARKTCEIHENFLAANDSVVMNSLLEHILRSEKKLDISLSFRDGSVTIQHTTELQLLSAVDFNEMTGEFKRAVGEHYLEQQEH